MSEADPPARPLPPKRPLPPAAPLPAQPFPTQPGSPPPLRPMDLVLRRDGSFWHEGVRVTHPGLARAFYRGVRWAEREQTFVVQLRHFRGWLEVEDTPFFVESYEADTGEIALSDQTREPLEAATLRCDPDDVLRCRVKSRWPARFTRQGQALLLDALEPAPATDLEPAPATDLEPGADADLEPGADADAAEGSPLRLRAGRAHLEVPELRL